MPRLPELYLEDIISSCNKILEYTKGLSKESFLKNSLVIDAVIRNIEIIGEATKQLPSQFKVEHSNIPWREISGIRDVMIHGYFGVDLDLVWDVVKNKVPELRKVIQNILKQQHFISPFCSSPRKNPGENCCIGSLTHICWPFIIHQPFLVLTSQKALGENCCSG